MSVGIARYQSVGSYIKRYWFLYLLVLPGFLHNILFRYVPMYGLLIVFKDYKLSKGILFSPFVKPIYKHFEVMFQESEFYRALWNTVLINIYNFTFGFAFIILLALILNELKIQWLKKSIQTAIYLPHFLSWVIFAGLVISFLSPSEGPVNNLIKAFGGQTVYFFNEKDYFRSILVISKVLKEAGFSTIIFLAGIAGINPELYESAIIDGAHRGHMMWYITLPRIKPTIAVLMILNVASLFNSNFDQVFNLYNPLLYETGDVLSTYLYRTGLVDGRYEMGTALGLIFNIFGLTAVIITNRFVKKMDVMGIF